MVALAKHPKKDKFPDFKAAAITYTYLLFPKLIINAASALLRYKMEHNESKQDDAGNILEHSKNPLRVYGNPPQPKSETKIGLALLAGVGIGLAIVALNRNSE